MEPSAYHSISVMMILLSLFATSFAVAFSGSFYEDFDLTWGDHRAAILNEGKLFTLTLDQTSGSGFQSKRAYLFGRIDMQIKLVSGNSAGTVTAYYVIFVPAFAFQPLLGSAFKLFSVVIT